MFVSILMPVYNGGAYLKQAISSVLNQTYHNFEFIIINDGSTDNTGEIIDSFTDKRILHIKQENQGVARSLNNGLKLVKGEYIWRHDADDKCLPDQLEKQVTFLKQHAEFDLVSTQVAFMTNRGKIAWKYRQPKNDFFSDQKFVDVTLDHFNPYSPITHATVLMKTSVIKSLNGYRTEFLTSEDTDLWLRWIQNYKAAVLNYCSYFVRLNKTSATQKYKSSTVFYRNLAFDYYYQRKQFGSDPLMRNEKMPDPPKTNEIQSVFIKGKLYRSDLLDFHYKVMLNARDWVNVWKCITIALKDGWKLEQTWKGIILPIIGKKLVQTGIKTKSIFKSH